MRLPFVTTERALQLLTLLVMAFLVVYLLVFVRDAREKVECQTEVNEALISSVEASRTAGGIERDAMNDLVAGILASDDDEDTRNLLLAYQTELQRAATLRTDNPLPNPRC